MVEQWPPGEPAGLQLSAVDLPCKWRCLGAPCPAQVWLKMCRGVLAARSVSDVSRVWHAHKLQSPLVCSVLQATQGLRVWWYNLQRPAAPFAPSPRGAAEMAASGLLAGALLRGQTRQQLALGIV